MDEEEFDSLMQLQPFGTEDAMRVEAQWRRGAALAAALWGRTAADLERQLLARYPEIPPGFDLADFRRLQQSAQRIWDGCGRAQAELDLFFARFFLGYFGWRSALNGVGSPLRNSPAGN